MLHLTDQAGVEAAERAFAKLLPAEEQQGVDGPLSRQHMLRRALMQRRVVQHTGFGPEQTTAATQGARRRQEQHRRVHAAVHHNEGSAVNRATVGELLFDMPLPACERWSDIVFLTLCETHTGGLLEERDVLGNTGRSTLPNAVYAEGACGPHATINAQLRPAAYAIVSYADTVRELNLAAACKVPLTDGMRAHAGCSVESIDEGDADERDAAAQQCDGMRMWPPRAVLRADDAVVASIDSLVTRLDKELPKASKRPYSLGEAGIRLYMTSCAVEIDAASTADRFIELGVCVYECTDVAMHAAMLRAQHVCVCAHAHSRQALAQACERLSRTIARCM